MTMMLTFSVWLDSELSLTFSTTSTTQGLMYRTKHLCHISILMSRLAAHYERSFMKKKIILPTSVMIAILCIASVIFISKNYTHMRNEQYEYHGEYYSPSSGPYIKDHMISFSRDLIRIYSVKGDSERIYLVDSLSRNLYKKDSFFQDQGDVTGIFIKHDYFDDQETIDTIVNLYDHLSDESAMFDEYKPYNLKDIYLCYNGICASDDLFGYIYKDDNKYYYVEHRYGLDAPLFGALITSDVYSTLEKYFNS